MQYSQNVTISEARVMHAHRPHFAFRALSKSSAHVSLPSWLVRKKSNHAL